jgi:hypothetical protein
MTDLRKAAEGALAVMTAKPSSITSADWADAIDALTLALDNPDAVPLKMSEIKRVQDLYMSVLHPIQNSSLKVTDMTLRDWYAGQALMAFQHISNPNSYAVKTEWNPETIAIKCYAVADAMLAAREVNP